MSEEIKFDSLNDEVKKRVLDFIKSKKSRRASTIQGFGAGFALGTVTETSINVMLKNIGEKPVIHALALIPIGAIAGAFSQYKKGSGEVWRSKGNVGEALSKPKFLDKEEQLEVERYHKTHFAIVKPNGGLVLIPKTKLREFFKKIGGNLIEF